MTKFLLDTDEVYDAEEAAPLIGISIATMWRWIRDSKIVALKISGRRLIPKSEVDRLKAARESQEENKLIRVKAFIPKSELDRLSSEAQSEPS